MNRKEIRQAKGRTKQVTYNQLIKYDHSGRHRNDRHAAGTEKMEEPGDLSGSSDRKD